MATNVSNFSELKTAIEDTTTTEINVTGDIEYLSGGASVNTNKSSLVINFNNHTITDNNTLNFTDTIYVPSTTKTISVTVKNAVFSGRNYYGVIGVSDGNINTTITLDNINYTGPQFVYNKNGTTIIKDCTVLLTKNSSSANAQEFCEGNRIVISGNVKVDSTATGDAIIWYTGTNASLVVEENANFVVNASSTYFLYTDSSPTMLFKKNSSTVITTKSGLFYASSSSSHIAESFTLEENASFVAYKYNSNTVPMFKCLSNFTLGKNSVFRLYSVVISSTPLMYFGKTANISINYPQNVLLYNRGGDAFSFQTGSTSSPNTIQISAEMLRLWNVAKYPIESAGGFDNAPTSEYHKQDYLSNIQMTISASTNKILTIENNLVSGDTGYPINESIFALLTSKVVCIGTLPLTINAVSDQSSAITGITSENANIKIEYGQNSFTSAADNTGNFSVSVEDKIVPDTPITVSVNKEFLTKTLNVISVGSVTITNLENIKFEAYVVSDEKSLIFRQDPNYAIQVTDTRTSGGNWYLYAHILNPLTSNQNTINSAIVFRNNSINNILSATPMLVYTGKWENANKITEISWNELEGILLAVDPKTNYKKGDYTTEIYWQVLTEKLE